jgi:hypothetical protein
MRLSIYGSRAILGLCVIGYTTDAGAVLSCCEFPSIQDMRKLLQNASTHDVRLLLNLVYWSYRRSQSTLLTQASAEKNLCEQWEAWQSCADRRLNPKAVAVPFHQHMHHKVFEKLQEEFHITQFQYASIVELAADGYHYTHQPIASFVEALREQARQHVMHIMKQHLAAVAKDLEQHLGTQTLALRSDHRGLITYLINQIAVTSFAHLDTSWRMRSNQLMLEFLHIQELFNSIWVTIEVARTRFYETYFRLIVDVMREYKFPASSFTNLAQIPGETQLIAFELSI